MADDQTFSFTDYGRTLHAAEEVAAAAIDAIVTAGGIELYQKYLKKKAFLFAEKNITEHVLGQLEMCFVAHDAQAQEDSWDLEPEYVPREIDSWARMRLVHRQKVEEGGAVGDVPRRQAYTRRVTMPRHPRTPDNVKRPKDMQSVRSERMIPLREYAPVDDEEEKLREVKAQEKLRMVEKENKAREEAAEQELERMRVQELHEKMDRLPHTFDNNGEIIWVDVPKPERLPKVQETFQFNIKRDPRGRDDYIGKSASMVSINASAKSGAKKGGRQVGRKANIKKARSSKIDGDEFTDFFSKLQHGQPPILEVMEVKPGVVVESRGRKKVGPTHDPTGKRTMSRKEYVELAERDLISDSVGPTGTTSVDVAAGVSFDLGPDAVDGGVADAPPADAGNAAGGGTSARATGGKDAAARVAVVGGSAHPAANLPPLALGGGVRPQSSGNKAQEGAGAASPGGGFNAGELRTDPQAPHPAHRSKFEAIGNLPRNPRYHQPPLGGHNPGVGVAQPPIGATMGHGLVHHASAQEEFFYPSPQPGPALVRSATEGYLSKDRNLISGDGGSRPGSRAVGRKRAVSRGGDRGGGIDSGASAEDQGVIKPEAGATAYRSLMFAFGADQRHVA